MKHKFGRIFAAAAVAFLMAGTVYAAATFGTPTRTWLNPVYRFTVPVTSLTSPDKSICLAYSANGTAQTPVLCTCSGANCPGGADATYTCNIATNLISSTVTWDISAYTANNGCTGKSIPGPTGSFNTGPTAVSLASFEVQPQTATWLLPSGLILAFGAILLMLRRRAR